MENNKRETSVLKNTLILFVGIFVPRVINLLTTPIIVNSFSTAVYGQINLLTTTVLSLIVPLGTIQIEQANFRFILDAKDESEYPKILTNGYSILLVTMMLVAIGVFILPIELFNTFEAKLLVLSYIWIEILAINSRFVLRAFNKYKQYSFLAGLVVFVNFLLTAVFVLWLKLGYMGVILALALADLVGFIYFLYHVNIFKYFSIDAIDKEYRMKMLRYALPFLPNSISWYINQLSDRWMIRIILNASSNGIYALANVIPSIVNLLYPAFNLAWTDSAQRSVNDKDSKQYYNKMYKMLYRILSSGTIMLIAVTPILFRILSNKPSYYLAFYLTPILIVASYFYCLSQFLASIYVAFKRTKNLAVTTTIGAIINILINLILMAKFGVVIAVYSTLASNMFLYFYRNYELGLNTVKVKVKPQLFILSMTVMIICVLLVLTNNLYAWIACFILASFYALFIAGDIFFDIIKKFLKRV